MSREIWNEGRVVGYSAYEVYVKEHMAVDPDTLPASEREWLASSLGSGASVLLKLTPSSSTDNEGLRIVDIPLPNDSKLVAASTLVASIFQGKGHYNDPVVSQAYWADKIESYGHLINNNESSAPADGSVAPQAVPHDSPSYWTADEKNHLRNYLKIVDGIVIQYGKWSANADTPPTKEFSPLFNGHAHPPILRLMIKGTITSEVEILFTGFTLDSVITGTSGVDTSVNSLSKLDGDFLGPATFPWSNKIVFSIPTAYIDMFLTESYRRYLAPGMNDHPESGGHNGDGTDRSIRDTAIIDMQAVKPAKYYTEPNPQHSNYTEYVSPQSGLSAGVDSEVKDMATLGEGTAVLTIYRRAEIYPPALYASYVDHVDSAGSTTKLYPIDIVAPGSVKVIPAGSPPSDEQQMPAWLNGNQLKMYNYQQAYPGTYAISIADDGTLRLLDKNNNIVPGADVSLTEISHPVQTLSGKQNQVKIVRTQTGRKVTLSLAVSPTVGDTPSSTAIPTRYDMTADPSSILKPSGAKYTTHGNGKYTSTSSHDDGTSYHKPQQEGNLTWSLLLQALANDCAIDLLGEPLKTLRYNLPNIVSGDTGVLTIKGTGTSSIAGKLQITGALNVNDANNESWIRGNTTIGELNSGRTAVSSARSLDVTGNITGWGALTIKGTGPSVISGDLTIGATTSASTKKSLTVTKNLSVGGTADITGNTTIGGTAAITGLLTATGGIKVGTNYIEFSDGIRLYLSKTAPSGARTGDIGLGWGYTA